MILNSVEKFIYSLDNVYDLVTSVAKLDKVIDNPLDKNGEIVFSSAVQGIDVKVNNLSFSFSGNESILDKISFHVTPGKKVCIVGHEGAGKSLMLRLLTGGYSDFTGSVLINDVPINNYRLRSLHEHTGIILNEQDIFQGSVLDNITLGNGNITLQQVTLLASITGFDQYLPKLQDGYSTVLDVAGKRLSRSAVQKVLLMRALIHKPQLLLFENPWSALNTETKNRVEEYFLNEIPATTAIVVTNDLLFASRCDEVIVMEEGKIKAMGIPSEVLNFSK